LRSRKIADNDNLLVVCGKIKDGREKGSPARTATKNCSCLGEVRFKVTLLPRNQKVSIYVLPFSIS
jgi:hypothetical protein